MSYIFDDFVEFSDMKRDDYLEELKKEAEKLPLSSIIEHLNLDELGEEIARKRDYKFEKGTPFSFSIPPITCACSILAYPDKITLSRDDLEVREYQGESAVNFYDTLFKKIGEAIEDYNNNTPF